MKNHNIQIALTLLQTLSESSQMAASQIAASANVDGLSAWPWGLEWPGMGILQILRVCRDESYITGTTEGKRKIGKAKTYRPWMGWA